MPTVRARFIPKIESTGTAKKDLDVLLWGERWGKDSCADLDEIETLRDYLRGTSPSFCGIRILVPSGHADTFETLGKLDVRFVPVEIVDASHEILKAIGDKELASAIQTAFSCDADTLVVTNREWLPYVRKSFRKSLRYNFRMRQYEKEGEPLEGVVPVVINGKPGFIIPANDTTWNLGMFLLFMNRVLTELKKCL